MKRTKGRSALAITATLVAILLLAVAGQPVAAEDATWTGQFWNNPDLTGTPVLTRQELTIDFNWGGGSPAPGVVNDDNFSARWTRRVNFAEGNYRFEATMDDAMRVWLDGQLIIDGWWDSQEHTLVSERFVSGGEHDIRVDYYERGGMAVAKFSWTQSGGGAYYPNWKGEYFNNTTLSGAPVLIRDDRYLNQNWGTGSPAPGVVGTDFWSARWTRTLNGVPGQYRIILTSDDGARLWIGNQLVIDNWQVQAATQVRANYWYAGGPIPVRVEFFDQTGGALINVGLFPVPGGETVLPRPPAAGSCTAPTGLSAVVTSTVNLNVRSGPGTQFDVIYSAAPCETLVLTGFRSADSQWVQVRTPNGQVGWATAAYLQMGVPMSQLVSISG